jgi:hypothetical protein
LPKERTSQEDEFYGRQDKKLGQEAEFYQDLDTNTEEKSCCSAYALVIFFVLLFCLLALITILVARNLKTGNLPEISIPGFGVISLSQKNPTIELPITSEDLTAMLKSSSIENANSEISTSRIVVTGTVKIVFKTKVTLTIFPSVKDDKLYLSIIKMQSWKIGLPGIIRSSLEKSLNKIMDQNLESFYQNYKATDVQLEDGKMIIFGKLK